jgi:hypothetical protein
MSVLAEQLGGDWNAEGMSQSSPTLFVHHCRFRMQRKQDMWHAKEARVRL